MATTSNTATNHETDSWPVTLTVERDADERLRVPAADDAVLLVLEDGRLDEGRPDGGLVDDAPLDAPGRADVSIEPLLAAEAVAAGPNYLVARRERHF